MSCNLKVGLAKLVSDKIEEKINQFRFLLYLCTL